MLFSKLGWKSRLICTGECDYAYIRVSSKTNHPAGCELVRDDCCASGGILCAACICQGCYASSIPSHQRRRRRTRGSVGALQPTQLRPERLHLQSQHAAEPDPSDGRRGSSPTGLQPVRNAALCVAVRARHLWIPCQPAELSG